jgi:hypothetical protein
LKREVREAGRKRDAPPPRQQPLQDRGRPARVPRLKPPRARGNPGLFVSGTSAKYPRKCLAKRHFFHKRALERRTETLEIQAKRAFLRLLVQVRRLRNSRSQVTCESELTQIASTGIWHRHQIR